MALLPPITLSSAINDLNFNLSWNLRKLLVPKGCISSSRHKATSCGLVKESSVISSSNSLLNFKISSLLIRSPVLVIWEETALVGFQCHKIIQWTKDCLIFHLHDTHLWHLLTFSKKETNSLALSELWPLASTDMLSNVCCKNFAISSFTFNFFFILASWE